MQLYMTSLSVICVRLSCAVHCVFKHLFYCKNSFVESEQLNVSCLTQYDADTVFIAYESQFLPTFLQYML